MSTARTITLRKRMAAERERADTWSIKDGYCYLDEWCEKVYFEQNPVTSEPFPVWATVKRVPNNI